MQILSKLQRNSTYYSLIILAVFVNLFSSSFLIFPLLMGYFFLCSEFLIGFFYLIIFCLLHNFNLFLFFLFFLVYKRYLIGFIDRIFDKKFVDVVSLFVVYFFLYLYLKDIHFAFIYALYNFSFDLLIVRITKCKVKSFYF